MTDHQQTILDYALRETAAETAAEMATRLERCLSRSGYLPVLHVHDKGKPVCPQGFFMMEYRRLDDPRFRAITSLRTDGAADDMLQVSFDTVPFARERTWRGLVEAFRYRALQKAPVTLTASSAVESFIKGNDLPNGRVLASRYADLAYTLQHRTGHTFFIDPQRIRPDFLVVQATVEPGTYTKAGEARPSGLERLLNSRRLMIAVPTLLQSEDRGVYVRAEYALSIHDPARTPVQYLSMRQFSHVFPTIIGAHVRGDPIITPLNRDKPGPKNF